MADAFYALAFVVGTSAISVGVYLATKRFTQVSNVARWL